MTNELLELIKQVTQPYNIDPCFTYAVAMVESSCKGFRNNGFPVIRFEKHVFNRYLKKAKVPTQMLRKAACIKGSGWDAYNAALAINEHYAKLSTSFGMFQIMGFNHQIVGYDTVEEFVKAMETSVEKQIEAFCLYVINTYAKSAINRKDFAEFARKYNGPNYHMNSYDTKLETYYNEMVEFEAESEPVTEKDDKPKKRKGYTQSKG
jgi:hypothetical protein